MEKFLKLEHTISFLLTKAKTFSTFSVPSLANKIDKSAFVFRDLEMNFSFLKEKTLRIEASNSQLPLKALANIDIPLVVIKDLLLLENMVEKPMIHKPKALNS